MHDRDTRTGYRSWRTTQGSVAVLLALMVTMLLGFAALGTEIVFVLFKQRQMQVTASAAALAGATALMTGHPAVWTIEALAVATTAGFTTGVAGATVVPTKTPPLSCNYTASNYPAGAIAVEVTISQPQTLPLSSLFRAGPWNLSACAVALEGSSGGYCVLQLDGSTAGNVIINNGAYLKLNQCGLAVSAAGPQALSVACGSSITANTVSVGGTVYQGCNGITSTNGIQSNQAAVSNPYLGTAVPTGSGCKYNSLSVLGWQNPTLSADGVYCGGLSMGGGGTVTLNPGVYIINGGTFSLQGGTTLNGTGVTIVLTGSGSNYATVNIGNGANVNMSAPTSGATSGLVFFQDPGAPNTGTDYFIGGVNMTLNGALYFPSQTVDYSNGSSTAGTCTQLVAWRMSFAGGATFDSSCVSSGVASIGGGPSQLVE